MGSTVQGNGVSLTRLLRSSKLSLIEFFSKAQKWADMSSLKSEFRQKIDLLERNFAVSNVIFKKYQPIFVGLFKDPAQDPPKVNRSRKTKLVIYWFRVLNLANDFSPVFQKASVYAERGLRFLLGPFCSCQGSVPRHL